MDISSGYLMYDSDRAKAFARLRPAIGADVVAGMLSVRSHKNKEDLKILDAGCATGDLTTSLLQYGYHRFTLLDASASMLSIAKQKLAKEIRAGNVDIVEAVLPHIPFTDDSFDVVIFNQVFYHLGFGSDGKEYPLICQTLKEAHRVLRQHGTMIIVCITPFVIRESSWISKLIPRLRDIAMKQLPSMKQWDDLLTESKFKCCNKLRLLGAEVNGPYYSDVEGPLKREWLLANPHLIGATDEELKMMEIEFKRKKEDGTLNSWVRSSDKTDEYGLFTVIVCIAK